MREREGGGRDNPSPPPSRGEKSGKEEGGEEQIEVNLFCLCRGFVIVLRLRRAKDCICRDFCLGGERKSKSC